tara:strand:- start:1298 stop:1504 length:207 start_codon:yes stop_codon:yes gene_type:complete
MNLGNGVMPKEIEINQLADKYLASDKGTNESSFLLAEIFALIGEVQDEMMESVEKLKNHLDDLETLIG